ncbi:helix-turn-helix transcriptional regulator [Mesonia aestuariivivens]|uniref:AraC family transcriptional regulator n=1 Tax=Mesonia aestuariivivens TaxID=2796128 RepID=A0ABS6W2M0_9FLAO|nr:AraC family transcriptional regulator [Mesonia aestuariivivens]MBW2961969.1 AraC family transcriptional regulator [Mesonia aestuariivivens]
MYIKSKLKHHNFSLFNLDLSSVNELKTENLHLHPNDEIEIKCHLQYNKDFCIIDTQFSNIEKLVDVFHIKGDFIQISLVSKGDLKIENSIKNEHIQTGNVQFTFQSCSSWEVLIPSNAPTHYTLIILSKAFYLQLLKDENWIQLDELFLKVQANNFIRMGENKFPISFSIHQILKQLAKCEFPDEHKENYFKLKLKELFYVYYVQQQLQTPSSDIPSETLEKVRKAKAYLAANFNHTPTIKQLSRQVLLNEQKLKSTFKKVFGSTIRGYVIELKMKKALTLLENHTVYEISNILGYKSTSHFINMFKKHYGYTPKQTLKE